MKKASKTSPNQVDFSFAAAPPVSSRDGAAVVSLADYAASLARAKRAQLDQAIMARAAHLTSPPRDSDWVGSLGVSLVPARVFISW